MRWPSLAALAALAGTVALAGAAYQSARARPRIERELPWASSGVWLKADTHVHSKFSDGGSTVDELVDRAVANGCDVLAITDHTDGDLKAATPEYHAAIASARARVPTARPDHGHRVERAARQGPGPRGRSLPARNGRCGADRRVQEPVRRPEQGGREPGARGGGVRVASPKGLRSVSDACRLPESPKPESPGPGVGARGGRTAFRDWRRDVRRHRRRPGASEPDASRRVRRSAAA